MTTGEKISILRQQKNLTQEQLAELMNVSRQSISKWESDAAYPETDKLIALADYFGCSVDYLLRDRPIIETQKESEKTSKFIFRKEGLVLGITSFIFCIVAYIFMAVPFSSFETSSIGVNGYPQYFTMLVSFYQVAFYKVYRNDRFATGYNLLALLTFLLVIVLSILSVLHCFFPKKGFDLSIKILTSVLVVFSLIVGLGFPFESGTLILLCLMIVYAVLLWVLKPFRFKKR